MYGIYIHIPFCVSKCIYCDFASYPGKRHLETDYISALVKEITGRKGVMADTVYIGGGTPSVLSCDNIERLLYTIRNTFELQDNLEFTMEINPGTMDIPKARLLKKYGVNRISMGAQSFVDSELEFLGRIHKSCDTQYTYNMLRDEGFDNISLDLMYALPGQSMDTLKYSAERVVSLRPEHISCYGLKFEEGTPLNDMLIQGKVTECSEDTFADMYDYIVSTMKSSGYEHYEISNFARKGRESRHNLKYWQDEDYLGFGVCASSREGSRRYTQTPLPEEYLNGKSPVEDYRMDLKEQMSEFIILGLRVINSGVDKRKFEKKFGMKLDDVFERELNKVSPYVINTELCLKLRREALLVSNSIMCEFMDI